MRTLTCIHHPSLRWLCKTEGVNSIGQYTGQRNIFYQGEKDYTSFSDKKWIPECKCPPSDLRFAPEDEGAKP